MTPQTEVRESPPNVQTSEGEVVYLLCMEKEVAWDENTHDPWAVIMNVACWSEPRKFGRLWTGGQGEWCVSGSMLHCADQSCPTLCYPMDYSPLGSSVHGISQARILEWVAISYPRGIFPTWGLNLHLLYFRHWQVDSLPLCHLGSPKWKYGRITKEGSVYCWLCPQEGTHHGISNKQPNGLNNSPSHCE